MKCDRCNYDLVLVTEEIFEKGFIIKKDIAAIKDYYCPRMQERIHREVRKRFTSFI